jgi:hypothetical protein
VTSVRDVFSLHKYKRDPLVCNAVQLCTAVQFCSFQPLKTKFLHQHPKTFCKKLQQRLLNYFTCNKLTKIFLTAIMHYETAKFIPYCNKLVCFTSCHFYPSVIFAVMAEAYPRGSLMKLHSYGRLLALPEITTQGLEATDNNKQSSLIRYKDY